MPRYDIFVDTGNDGACVLFHKEKPIDYYRFKKDPKHMGLKTAPLKAWVSQYKNARVVIEDPAKVSRSMTTVAPQWFVVGQIFTILKDVTQTEPVWINSNSWQAWVRRETHKKYKDTKEMARYFAQKIYPEFVKPLVLGDKKLHSGIADGISLAAYFYHEEQKLLRYISLPQ